MTHCLNPDCPAPDNPDTHRFCQHCGWRLRLGDRYEALYQVGAGESSQTFVGRDRATLVQPQCLIKQFTPAGATRLERAAAAERWRKDIEHLAIASQHPQIPDLLAYFERAQQAFLVQQFLVGPHLDQQLQEKCGPLDSQAVWGFLRDVVPILQHLHRHQIIHRDIKPTNFRQPPGQPHWWLVDLGAIKPLTATHLARPGTVIGSAEYAAPEQLRGEATFASDLYSLGVVCLHLLTGLRPFDLFDGVNACWHWRSIVPDVDEPLAAVIDQMVQPNLRDRLGVVADLMPLLGLSVPTSSAPPAVTSRRGRQWSPNWEIEIGAEVGAMVPLPQADLLLVLLTTGNVEVRSLHHPRDAHQKLTPTLATPSTLAAHPHQPAFAVGSRRDGVELWQLTQGTWQSWPGPSLPQGVTQLLILPHGNQAISGDERGCLHCWDWSTGKILATWQEHAHAITSLAVDHAGDRLASGDAQGFVKLWHLPTQDHLRTFSRQPGGISALAWAAHDHALVTAGWDVTLRWRCPVTGGLFHTVKAEGFWLPVRSLLTHPTQPWLIAGSQDGHLLGWTWPPDSLAYGGSPKVKVRVVARPDSSPIIGLCLDAPVTLTPSTVLSVTQAGRLVQRSQPGRIAAR